MDGGAGRSGGDSVCAGDPLLFGGDPAQGLVAVEAVPARQGADEAVLFWRRDGRTEATREPLALFLAAERSALAGCPVAFESRELAGTGPLNVLARFSRWRDVLKARDWLASTTGVPPAAADAPYLFLNDPVQQHLMLTGRTLFKGLRFEALRRLQMDIECRTSPGYEFCNAEREGDRIIAIALCGDEGRVTVLSGAQATEKELLERFVAAVREEDPDVIEGHNLFNFDLPYLAARARRCGVALALGRDGSPPRRRASRFAVGDRTLAYERFEIFGRHVVDTLFLTHAYDVLNRSLDGFGLKEVAAHFGLAAPDRTYLDGRRISETFARAPDEVLRYAGDDARETRALSSLLAPTYFAQAQMLPYTYQNVCVRGQAAKIDALMIREYLRRGQALPKPDAPWEFAGGYTDLFVTGIVRNVHHCDVRSLYPSLMLAQGLGPRSDELGVFLKLLDALRTVRLEAKRNAERAPTPAQRAYFHARQGAFKVLINAFYGYLGFAQARFSDFQAAERVAERGRALLASMLEWLRARGAQPIEIDTDGIYFLPPVGAAGGEELQRFREDFARSLPPGIEVEFDGVYRAMFSYKMKNYALLTEEGELIVKGAALKSRGLEPFQRDFLRELLRLRLECREAELPALKARYAAAIRERKWPIERLAKTERLQEAPAAYAAKRAAGRTARNAVYELALKSGRPYRAGDPLSFYVTGTQKNVPLHENCKLAAEWNPEDRDENTAYYLAKLEALYRKFGGAEPASESLWRTT
mgnify:CR=1 FL=1